jgi:hypothetical protein
MLTRTCTACGAEKSVDEYYKMKAGKYGVRAECKFCSAERRKKYYLANRKAKLEQARAYRQANKEAVAEQRKAYRKANPHIINAIKAKRRATKQQATPAWVDLEAIKEMYQLAAIFNSTGINLQVDHIVPLQSDRVCGLHCEANLQLLPASDNIKKGNRYWPDM